MEITDIIVLYRTYCLCFVDYAHKDMLIFSQKAKNVHIVLVF